MRCIGTLEFIDEFQENCQRTQQKFFATKNAKKSQETKQCSPHPSEDAESDKENSSPIQTQNRKRKRQTPLTEVSKILKPLPLTNKNLTVNIKESEKAMAEISSMKNDENIHSSSPKLILTPSTKAKCDSSTKTELPELKPKTPKISESPSISSTESEQSNRRTRSRSAARNIPKKPLNESKTSQDSPKSRPVPVIVKLEKTEESENIMKADELVWIPSEFVSMPEAEKPKSSSPIAGDEAGKRVEKSPESSASTSTTIVEIHAIPSAEVTRKSVIEKPMPKIIETVGMKEPKVELRTPRSAAKKAAAKIAEEEEEEDEEEEGENEEERKKFGKISDLITEEQKLAIEKFYTVDMSAVDEEVVGEKIVFLEKKTFGCTICKAVYPRQDKCQVHIWGHLDMKPYRCNACDFATVTVSNIRCHIRKSHLKIKPYACELCEKRYVTAFLLEEHMNTHTGSRPYSCNQCKFTSASRQVLTYHIATHKPVKDITCNVCGKQFYTKGRMRAHMVIHNKDKAANMCKLCSIYLCNAEALERHMANVHSKDFICNFCDKRCRSKKALNNHQNVHTAAKYKCNLCPNVYKSSHILKEHILKHKGIRKYKCNVCEKDFAQQSHLAAHMAVHSEKRFLCPGCSRPFNRHDNMKMHTKRCDAFLANPELRNLLTIRRSRSKPVQESQKSADHESSASDDSPPPKEKQPSKVQSEMQKSTGSGSQNSIGFFTVGGLSNELIESEDLTMIIGNTVVIPCS